jgi:hypothetical protein
VNTVAVGVPLVKSEASEASEASDASDAPDVAGVGSVGAGAAVVSTAEPVDVGAAPVPSVLAGADVAAGSESLAQPTRTIPAPNADAPALSNCRRVKFSIMVADGTEARAWSPPESGESSTRTEDPDRVGHRLAYVPFAAPMVMPGRIALGASSAFEIAASLTIGVATVRVVGRLSAVVYRRAIVRTGRRLKLRDALRSVPR